MWSELIDNEKENATEVQQQHAKLNEINWYGIDNINLID